MLNEEEARRSCSNQVLICRYLLEIKAMDCKKDGIVSTLDDLYGAAEATLNGDTFIWKDNTGWVGYYQKVVAE
jgi:hypothetical protein